ncbi:MAG: TIGR04086 family membrane protein [Clostridiales bacterium]|nr:TIGR04086 family membrane protein [Clostridiales bacterium]
MRIEADAPPRESAVPIKALFFGTLIAYAITCIAFVVCAVMLRFTGFSEDSVPLFVTITSVVAVLVAGFDAAKGANGGGWFWGMIAGGIYAVLWILFGILFTKSFSPDARMATIIALSVAGGGLGGMIGINFRKSGK